MKENMRDFSVLKQRILQYLDFKGITKYECYKNTGITNGVLSQPNGMSDDNLLNFLSYYSDISPDWLLAGCGSMLRDDNQTKISKIVPIESEFEPIPIVDISVAAGYGCENPDFIEVVETISLPYNMLHRNKKYFCVKVRGESMSPTLLDCSYLILRLLDLSEWNEIKDNHVYAVSYTHLDVYKRQYISQSLTVNTVFTFPLFRILLKFLIERIISFFLFIL